MMWCHFQIPVESTSMAVPDSSAQLASTVPTPVLTQPVSEQVVDAAPTAVEVLQAAATEPSLAELGLAGHTPVGLIQNLLEFMHMDLGLPWWGAIVVGKHTNKRLEVDMSTCRYSIILSRQVILVSEGFISPGSSNNVYWFSCVLFLILFFLFPVSLHPSLSFRNGVCSFGCVSSHSEGPEGGS